MAQQLIIEKRRGRPPKNLVQIKSVKENIQKQLVEELVLYLPNFDDKNNDNNNDNDNNFDSDSDSELSTIPVKSIKSATSILHHLPDKNVSVGDMSEKIAIIDRSEKYIKNDYKNISIDKLIDELNRRETIIINLKSKLKDKTLYNENTIAITKENKKKLLNIGLITINKNKLQIAEKTNIVCWWCTYNFDTAPCFLPDHFKNNRYYVFGNFCGFSCMLAYNENLDDYRKSVRSVLIKQMYRNIFQNDNMQIKSAGPRELLIKFGGIIDISQYRDPNNICVKTFKMTIPPLIPLISEYEEVIY